jgi:cysteine desulfurase
VQAAGKIPLKVSELPVDLLTISGHKFHAPKGVGALYVRRGITFPPFMIGGHQERNRRAGTENVASIIGMGKAAEIALPRVAADGAYVKQLRDGSKRCFSTHVQRAE